MGTKQCTSAQDIAFTKAACDASKIVGVPILDHVIVTRDGAFSSFLERGCMPGGAS